MENSFKLFSQNWTLDPRQKRQLEAIADPATHTFSSLVKDYVRSFRQSLASKPSGCRPLKEMAIKRLHMTIQEAPDKKTEIKTIISWIVDKEPILRAVLETLPYPMLRIALTLVENEACFRTLTSLSILELNDHEQAMLACEQRIRGADTSDGSHLMTINDFKEVLSLDAELQQMSHPTVTGINLHTYFSRPAIPQTHFALLDEQRIERCHFRRSNEAFKLYMSKFAPALEGFDWSNALLTGELVLDLFYDDFNDTKCYELRLFDLDADAATAKIQDIETCWTRNMSGNGHTRAVKTMDHITLFCGNNSDYRVRIPLRIWKNPTDALLDISLDPCALGFDGNRVIMLPRCARAIETGYSILTTRLVFGQPILESPLLRERQLLEHANKGFGVRILPAYAKLIEDESLEPPILRDLIGWASNPRQCPADEYQSLKDYRILESSEESGDKTLRRIAFLGQDLTNRTMLGVSALQFPFDPNLSTCKCLQLSISASTYQSKSSGIEPVYLPGCPGPCQNICLARQGLARVSVSLSSVEPKYKFGLRFLVRAFALLLWHVWKAERLTQKVATRTDPTAKRRRRDLAESLENGRFDIMDLTTQLGSGETAFEELAGVRQRYSLSLSPFESFVRLEEARSNLKRLQYSDWDDDEFDHWQSFAWWPRRLTAEWPSSESFEWLYRDIDRTDAFSHFIKSIVNDRTQGTHFGGYRDYLTGRIRIAVTDDLSLAMSGRLSLPMLITQDAEHELASDLPAGAFSPICRAAAHATGSSYTGGIPPVPETQNEQGNMRYLHIETADMWRGLDEVRDEAFIVGQILSNLTAVVKSHVSCASHELIEDLRDTLCQQPHGMLPQCDNEYLPGTLIGRREAMLFRAWALAIPSSNKRLTNGTVRQGASGTLGGDLDSDYLYPVPENLFWGPELEGGEERQAKRRRTGRSTRWWFRPEAYEFDDDDDFDPEA